MTLPTPGLLGVLSLAGGLVVGASLVHATIPVQNIQITSFGPAQLVRGKVTLISVQGKGLDKLEAVEVSPADGIVTEAPVAAEADKKGEHRWKLSFSVDAAAAVGKRSVVFVTPRGRSAAQTINIPDHVPEISDLKIELVERSPLIVAFSVTARDAQSDLAEQPVTHAQLICKTASTVSSANGIVTARLGDGVRIGSAFQDYQARASAGACMLVVRVSDKNGNVSESLSAPVKF